MKRIREVIVTAATAVANGIVFGFIVAVDMAAFVCVLFVVGFGLVFMRGKSRRFRHRHRPRSLLTLDTWYKYVYTFKGKL